MPVPQSKQGKPLGGIGANAMTRKKHSLVLDDRLLSKQYISATADAKVDNSAFGGSWADITDIAPSKGAVQAYLNSLEVTTSAWTQEDASASNSKTRNFDTGYVGIGAGSGLAFSSITERLTVDGNIKSTGDVIVGDDISLLSDSAILNFGADSDTSLTHTDGTGLTLNSTNKLCFNDTSQFIQGSSATILSIGATDEIDLTATTIQVNGAADINGAADVSGNLTVGGNTTITGNLTVNGTATAIDTTNVAIADNIFVLNNDVTGTPSENAGIEVERGTSDNVSLRWNETTDKWQITNDGSTYNDISTAATTHDAITIVNQGTGLLALSDQVLTVNDVMVKNSGDTMTGQLVLSGDSGSSGTTALSITGGNSAASNAAVSITGHLEATTKSFNIPHPLIENKRLVYGSLEGPEHGMYARGSFDVEDERRKVAIDLPLYWSRMVYPDYTVNLTSYGDYNVWIKDRDENGFWVETNSDKEWSFDWNVIGGRKDAKLVVEPDA